MVLCEMVKPDDEQCTRLVEVVVGIKLLIRWLLTNKMKCPCQDSKLNEVTGRGITYIIK